MTEKQELEILLIMQSIPYPPRIGMLIVDKGTVKVRFETIKFFERFKINLKETEPIEKIENLAKYYYDPGTVAMMTII